jgi:Flp pilus assembly protein TadG
MRSALRRLHKSDRADSNLVTLVIVMPLIIAILITIIDTSIFFSNRSLIQASARDAARTVAIMGGNGTADRGTPLEIKYGLNRTALCNSVTANSTAYKAKTKDSTAIECNLMVALGTASSLIATEFTSVKCDPRTAQQVGATVTCTVEWEYGGIPASALSYIGIKGTQVSAAASSSEVKFSGDGALVSR